MEGKTPGNTANDGTVHGPKIHDGTVRRGTPHRPEPTGAALILRVLRVSLHVGFAVLLFVALVRFLSSGIPPARTGSPWGADAAPRRRLPRRHFLESCVGPDPVDPRPYSAWWLGGVSLLWLLLIWASADFVWLAFPLFFLQLHVPRRRLALPAIALSTVLVIAALWFHTAVLAGRPHRRNCPWCWAPRSAQPSLWSRGWPTGRCSWRRKTSDWRPKTRRTRAELARTQHNAGTLAERTRLAREIHDTLAQGLSSIVLMGRAAEKALDNGDTAVARERLRIVRQTASANLAEARNFVRGLHPRTSRTAYPSLPSLQRLCEKTEAEAAARGAGLRCRFDVVGAPAELPTVPHHAAPRRPGEPRQRTAPREGERRRRHPLVPGPGSGPGHLRRRHGFRPRAVPAGRAPTVPATG